MKRFLLIALVGLVIQGCSTNESILVLEPSQSMSITGKGPGQDAAMNPFSGETSYALIKNIGTNSLSARVQQNGKIIQTITILPEENRKVLLLDGYELYLDSALAAKAQVNFRKGGF